MSALKARQYSPLLLQVTSTHDSELKRETSQQHGILDPCSKIVALDDEADSEKGAFNFRLKKLSFVGMDEDILAQVHEFSNPLALLMCYAQLHSRCNGP